LGTVNHDKVSASRDWSDNNNNNNNDTMQQMLQSTVVTAYFFDNVLMMEEASRMTTGRSRDDKGTIGSRENLVHGTKQQSTNDGVEQTRRHVGVNNITQQSKNTKERGREDGGDNNDWYRGATTEGRGRRRKSTTIRKEAYNHQLQDNPLVD
jgi:hypothetical protein